MKVSVNCLKTILFCDAILLISNQIWDCDGWAAVWEVSGCQCIHSIYGAESRYSISQEVQTGFKLYMCCSNIKLICFHLGLDCILKVAEIITTLKLLRWLISGEDGACFKNSCGQWKQYHQNMGFQSLLLQWSTCLIR